MFNSFGPGANCTLDLCPIEWTVYQYRPNLPVSIVFMALYAIALIIHIYLGLRWRSWGFMTFMVIGCLYAIIGYGGRVILWTNPWSFAGFMIQMVCITGTPVFFTATIYVTLSRAIRFFALEISRLPPRLFYWLFISADILCLALQAIGGALTSTSSGSSQIGVDIAMAGLILQVIILVIFCGFFVDYMIRYVKLQRSRMRSKKNTIATRQRLFFGGLASAIILILARCAYRVDELSQGYSDSTKITDEQLFIGLEGVLIYVSVISLFIGHPGFGHLATRILSHASSPTSPYSARP
ncbi:hypothetical protein P152DRAFT_508052 [Eremomyces bilateralis CBS 781.70]|uniref:RTA1-domain-containing protein n=1 Tax=Eremomyces bilateralis CBS 781.70 TaxID=1392243 RepID=A0A6G1G094_9PEZI|nr:uncharacterized protein P152DRAFT_508052 [Eremomyces bilateralis CBS 781.70]KAF1811474.1 hypothetical protein P152DRAFT_508052 [Eremomyces bilateralis CBS 781.70]